MARDTNFLSCDWGTTSFRLRLVSTEGFRILEEVNSKQGIADAFEEWSNGGANEGKRIGFYNAILKNHLKKLQEKAGDTLKDIPLIISGMASSNIGMMELPYKTMPFALDGSDLATHFIGGTDEFPNPTLLISGVRTDDDVMRGEEVQVVGCVIVSNEAEQLIIHPGTHCKHIMVKGDKATSFQTFMTGEFFSLLSTKSILAPSVEKGKGFDNSRIKQQFELGVQDSETQNLLHTTFLIRTATLFAKRTKEENFYYLSGLLIGSELNAFPKGFTGQVILAGDPALLAQYKVAMDVRGMSARVAKVTLKDGDDITFAGQYAVFLHQKKS